MKNTVTLLLSLVLILGISSCKEDEPTLGDPPSEADAAFTFEATAGNANIIDFTATNSSLTAKWDFGNGTTGEGTSVQSSYPNKGTYTVTLTVFNSGGSASSSQDIVIAEDDPTLLASPLFTYLTGGVSGPGSKTWVLDSTRKGHMGVGDPIKFWADYWEADPLIKSNTGIYDDKYVFTLSGFKYDMITNGNAYVNGGHEGGFSSSYENKDDYTVTFPDQLGETWTITENEADTILTVSGSSFIGFYAGTQEYQIMSLDDSVMYLRYQDTKEDLVWYLRLVIEDYPVDGGGGGGSTGPKYTLPIDFESIQPEWTTFGGSSDTTIANPYSGGINTSATVLETVHGFETWAGIYIDLENPLDLTGTDSTISLKIYAPSTGTMRFKIENSSKSTEFEERDIMVTEANKWIEVSAGFSTAATGKYDKLVLFPGWDVANAGTFYIDDIEQE